MTREIIEQMRKNKGAEKEHLANSLALLGDEFAIRELKRMFEGRFRPFVFRYTYSDQLIALRAIGNIISIDSQLLDYLNHAFSYRSVYHEEKTYPPVAWDHEGLVEESKPIIRTWLSFEFPNLKGELKKKVTSPDSEAYRLFKSIVRH